MEGLTRRRLALIGPMGSGKSSLARRYTAKYGGTVFDTDAEFTRRNGDIPAFFARNGEEEFRKAEQRLLVEAAQSDASVISTGGGAALCRKGMYALRAVCDVVYLTAPTAVLEKRIKSSDRPLKNSLVQTIRDRAPLYEKYADYTIDTSVDSVRELERALEKPRRNRYDVVLCDADDTLLDFKKACAVSVAAVVKKLGLGCDAELAVKAFRAITCDVWHRLERGELTREMLGAERVRLLSERLKIRIDAQKFDAAYADEMRKTRYLRDGAIDFLTRLGSRGARVYIITNSFKRIAEERIKPLAPYVDGTFVSEDIGAYKPDGAFFDAVVKAVGCDKRRVVVFGDGETSDIAGGVSFGLDTCLYDPIGGRETAADYRVREYSEFLDIL